MLICGAFRSAWGMLHILAVYPGCIPRSTVEALASSERRGLGRFEPRAERAWDCMVRICFHWSHLPILRLT